MIVKDIILPKGGFKLKACGDRYFQIAEPTEVQSDYRHRKNWTRESVRVHHELPERWLGSGPVHRPHRRRPPSSLLAIHDCNYTPCINKCYNHAIDRKTADDLLLAMLLFAGESKFKARVIWASVRVRVAAYKDDEPSRSRTQTLEINNTLRRIE